MSLKPTQEKPWFKYYPVDAESADELVLNGNNVGEHTFTSVNGGWSIMNSEGKYLAVEGGKLVLSENAFAWNYSNGKFSSTVSSGSSTGLSWLDSLLGNKKSTTYYLVASGSSAAVSTSGVDTKLMSEVTGEHNYSNAKPVDGKHVYTCHNCGYEKIEICNNGENCVICSAKVDVSVSIEKVSSGNWLEILLGRGSTSNKVTITTVATGTEVTSVEYSLDGTSWTKGTSFTTKNDVSSFSIRVNASNGMTYNYSYSNGSVSAK